MSNSFNNLMQPIDFKIAYEEAVHRVSDLNVELQQKDKTLEMYQKEIVFMKEKMDECIKALSHIPSLLVNTEANFKSGHDQMLSKIKEQEQVIMDLEQANHAWSERTIKLEFELLAAKSRSN